MDFFALPDVFQREMMQFVTMKDRLRLRLTSHAFSKLVAKTNAGYSKDRCAMEEPMFDHKKLPCEDTVSVYIGGAKFHCVPRTEEGFERILCLRSLLFRGIALESFTFEQLDDSIPFAFIRKLINHVKIRNIHLSVNTGLQLEHALQLIADYKQSTVTIDLWFRPEMHKLLSIPPMNKMKIALHNESLWSLDSLFKLLAAQPNLNLVEPVQDITLPNLVKVLQVLSADDRPRRVRFRARNETFELVAVSELQGACLEFRYRRCFVELKHVDWTGDRENVGVHISNCEGR
ncbi:hypothetical protein PRIPAC_80276 [Pristionchus pacificus]|uniref:Uncharacterized protein n=1 Tax=Pristionchus pacificus TaxID=54126 RepID=A0A2A6CMU4_PRIPA|nr:hypothetical protein PRIPAC_80276 [Pristionchus pacificus]|eukprot:PDM79429.1 hypothetical protein PRIPAC_32008 [Pristionchus pacificus]